MNKTLTINISGVVFHIEEDAFEKLSKYLNTIKGYFKDSEGRDEIMADIEARIAEILQESTNQTKQVVVMNDIDKVIAALGQPEEFADTAGAGESSAAQQQESRRKRIFRDPDDKVLGGIASGLASYFNTDPIWLRLAFVLLALISFGTGMLVYIIMWLIIPKAKTTSEKLEMRGEHINISNIKKTVHEEMGHMKRGVKDFAEDAKEMGSRSGSGLREVAGTIFKIIGKIIAVFIIIICLFFLAGIIGSIFGLSQNIHIASDDVVISYSFHEFINTTLGESGIGALALTTLILVVGVPLIALLYFGIKILFGLKKSNRIFKYGLLFAWLTGLVIGFFTFIRVIGNFSEEASSKHRQPVYQTQSDTIYLKVNESSFLSEKDHHHRGIMIDEWKIISSNGKKIAISDAKLDIIPSLNDSLEIVVVKSARGSEKQEAVDRARNVKYHMEQDDSLFIFDPFFEIVTDDKWRAQEVKIILKVPKNKVVYLEKNMDRIIHDIDNVSNTWDRHMVGRRWKMTSEGLECIDCEGLDISVSIRESSRYHDFEKRSEKALRDAEKALEKAEQKLEKLREKKEERNTY